MLASAGLVAAGELAGVTVMPHPTESTLRYREPRPPAAARVQLFVRGPAAPGQFNGQSPAELLAAGRWAWHDLAAARPIPAGALAVWTFNGGSAEWGVGGKFTLAAEGLPESASVTIGQPMRWISAVTFLADAEAADAAAANTQPDTIVVHIANESAQPLAVSSLRLWLPREGDSWMTLWPQPPQAATVAVPADDKGFLKLRLGRLPLTYAAVELTTDAGPLWAHVRIKREAFDISGGWIGDRAAQRPFLHLLKTLHVNTGHFQEIGGYTDDAALYRELPLKRFGRLWPLARWDADAELPQIHAVEFLGEPQYGGGRPVPPQEVFDALLPYRPSRLATTVTHSEERLWHLYAGLSDYPHYDAYRVVAPSADSWRQYDRWGGRRIEWGAPLETIGDLSRSLRELNRPAPCAVWSQGPHDGWGGPVDALLDGRSRRSPTPEELRAQALHALSTRITSLYWFNLSLPSLIKFPDTWEPIRRLGREIRMLEPYYLEGDAYRFERRLRADGRPDWDLASIAAPEAAVLFALDTAYDVDGRENVFQFAAPRAATFQFTLPSWLREPVDLFRVDAKGVHDVAWRATPGGVVIDDCTSRDAIYVAAKTAGHREAIERRRQAAIAEEDRYQVDLEQLKHLLE